MLPARGPGRNWFYKGVTCPEEGNSGVLGPRRGYDASMSIRGVQFLSDGHGNKTAVLIDLRRHRQVWEDIYDQMIAESRKSEPRVAWKDVKRRLQTKRTKRG